MIVTNDISLERKLVATMLQSLEVLGDLIVVWEGKRGKDWFTGVELRWIAVKAIKHYRNYHSCVSKSLLLSSLKEETAKAQRKEEERESIQEQYDILIERLLNSESSSRSEAQAISERLTKLLVNREIVETGKRFGELLESGDTVEGIKDLKSSIVKIENLEADTTVVLGDIFDLSSDIEYIRDRRANPQSFIGIPTGIRVFDEETQGVHPGETGLIIGPSGRGKTTLACEVGYNALKAGYNVCHFTIESSLRLVKFKYYARIAQIPYNKFKFAEPPSESTDLDWVDEWIESMGKLEERVSSSLKIADIPEGCTPSLIKEVCTNHFGNWRPDLVIIDHQGLLCPDSGQMGKGRLGWDTQGELTQNLMAKGRSMMNSRGERGIGMWILAQGNPSLLKKKAEDISVADVGLSYLIAQPAHYIIHILRDNIQAANEEAILKITKVRDGKDSLIAYVNTDFSTSTFIKREQTITQEESGMCSNSGITF